MPLEERTYDLADTAARLHDQMREAAREQAEYPVNSDGAKQAAQEGQRYQQFRAGLLWACGWPDDPERDGAAWDTETVTLASLKNGERKMVADLAERNPDLSQTDLYVAAGTVTAPYLKHDPHNTTPENVVETALALADTHPHFVDWAEHAISSLGGMGSEGNAYRTLVQEMRTSPTSPNANG